MLHGYGRDSLTNDTHGVNKKAHLAGDLIICAISSIASQKWTPKQKLRGSNHNNYATKDISLVLSNCRGSPEDTPQISTHRANARAHQTAKSGSPNKSAHMARKLPAKATSPGTPLAKKGAVHFKIIIFSTNSALAGHSTA